MMTYKERLNTITTFIFDIDGVLTDGNVTVFNNELVRTLNSKNAFAIQYAVKMGYNVFIISGGESEALKRRLIHLGVKEVFYLHLKNYWSIKNYLLNID